MRDIQSRFPRDIDYFIQRGVARRQVLVRLEHIKARDSTPVRLDHLMARLCSICGHGLREIKTHPSYVQLGSPRFFSCDCFEPRMSFWREHNDFEEVIAKLEAL